MARVQLVSQVAGALLAGALVFLVVHRHGMPRRTAVGAIALIPVAVAALIGISGLHDATRELLDQRDASKVLSREEAELQGGSSQGVNVTFLSWARTALEKGQTFYPVLGPTAKAQPAVIQWLLYQLGPNTAVDSPEEADLLVLYEANAREAGVRPAALTTFAPGFAIAKGPDAR